MENATNRYKVFPAEDLRGPWGSCGSHLSTAALTEDYKLPPPSPPWARRVGKKPNVVFQGLH